MRVAKRRCRNGRAAEAAEAAGVVGVAGVAGVAGAAGAAGGGSVRAVLECAGVRDILTKSLGSTNPHNMVRATIDALQHLTTQRRVAKERGVEVEAIHYRPRQGATRG